MKDFKTVDAYIASYPAPARAILKKFRATILKIIPAGEESILYGIPSFSLNGSYIVHFGGFEKHISLFPTSEPIAAFKKELSPYKTGKGTIQFPIGTAVPYALVSRIVKYSLNNSIDKARKKAAAKGIHLEFHANGVIWARGKLKGRKMEGKWEWFRKDGTLMRSGSFKKGVQSGTWTTYDRKGKVYKVTKMSGAK